MSLVHTKNKFSSISKIEVKYSVSEVLILRRASLFKLGTSGQMEVSERGHQINKHFGQTKNFY
jgi:hypothetical protein